MELEDLPELTHVACHFSDGLRIKNCPAIQDLYCRGHYFNRKSSPYIVFDQLPNLIRSIDYFHSRQYPDLTSLRQVVIRVPENFPAILEHCPQLEVLELKSKDDQLTAAEIAKQIRHSQCAATLRSLSINRALTIDDPAWEYLAQLPCLERLHVQAVIPSKQPNPYQSAVMIRLATTLHELQLDDKPSESVKASCRLQPIKENFNVIVRREAYPTSFSIGDDIVFMATPDGKVANPNKSPIRTTPALSW